MRMLTRTLTAGLVAALSLAVARADDWPQWMGPNRDDVWRETGILDKFPPGGPTVKWRVPIGGGYAGPAVAAGRVYVFDYLTPGDTKGDPNQRSAIDGTERVLCVSAADGKPLWEHKYHCPYRISYPAGPRCTPTVAGGKVYTLGAEGDLHCLDAANGSVVWKRALKDDYKIAAPMWGFTGHPLVDGQKLICLVGGDGTTAVAFDKDTGRELWRNLSSKEPGYCPPSVIRAGGTRQLIMWTSEAVYGLDPETGKKYWSIDLEPKYGMAIAAPRQAGDYLFAGGIGWVAALMKLAPDHPAAEVVWRGGKETAVYPVASTPFVDGDILYGVDQPGQLRAIRLRTGERLWETLAPTTGSKPASSGTAFLVKNGDRFFIFSETGDLIIAKLSPKGYEEISRAKLLQPTNEAFGRPVVWSHPAFANKCVYARNDKELVCASLAAE